MALTISINQAASFVVNVWLPGPTGPAGPQGPAGPAGAGGVWGSITGTLTNQTDLVSALAGKYSTTNPAGYIDLTTAGLYFYPLTGNPSSFATQAWVIGQNYLTVGSLASYATQSWVNTQLAGYALQSWVTDHAYPLTGNPSGFLTSASLSGYATQGWVNTQLEGYATLTYVNSSFYGIDNPSGFITASALSPYLTSATAASTYQTLAGMSSYLTTSAAASTYAVIARGLPAAGTTGQVLSKVNGTDYNATWTTIIPGDRYLTTSTSAMSVSNGAKTFTAGTGLSYTPTQDVTIAHDSANHMHGTVTSYNSGTGAMVVDVQNHSGSGTYTSWTINVGGAIPAASVIWGDITGTLGDQSDLATALNAKLETSTAATTYLALAGGAMTGSITSAGTTYDTEMAGDLFGVQLSADHSKGSVLQFNGLDTYDGSSHMLVTPTGLTFPDSTVQTTAYTGGGGGGYISSVTSPLAVTSGDLSIDLSSYLTTSTAASTYVPFTGGTMSGLLTSESGTNIAGMNNDGFTVTQAGDYVGGLSSTVMQVYHSEAETYGTGTSSGSVTRNEISHSYSGFDSSGSVSRYAQLANTSGFTGGFNTVPASGTYSLTADGIAGSQTNYGTTTSFSYGPGGVHFQSGSTYAEFTLSGIRFPDGSTQSTAASSGLSAPPYYTAVWAYGGWYSANVTNIMDGNYTYWNVITV